MLMDGVLIDNLVVFSGLIYYSFLCVVYLLRAHERDKLELMLAPAFSALLVPFAAFWIANILGGADLGRLITGFPMIAYLAYDFWYRLITRKKPLHHPDRWPVGLVIYLILLQVGSIALNWYGYLASRLSGNMLVVAYFIMISCFGYYQQRYNKRKKSKD